MRNLLIIFLVLGMTSMASAALVGTVTGNGSNYVELGITGATGDGYIAFAVDADGTLSSIAAGTNAPGDASSFGTLAANGLSSLGTGELWAMIDTSVPYEFPDGQWLTSSFAFVGAATSSVISAYEVDELGGTTLLSSYTIPEPMTIVLLGLGGLFLRRRK